jgi:8-oxo-dGTP pyrophosphatase MutT (NUDIX family)
MAGNDIPDGHEALYDLRAATQLLGEYRPRRKHSGPRRMARRSAVGLFLSDHRDARVSVLMIKRAERESDPWSGHMAFPGGRKDPADRDTLATAKRETMEEVALDVNRHARRIGRLSDIEAGARRPLAEPMIVTPYVFRLHSVPPLVPNYEVEEVQWVPLAFLADRSNRRKMTWERRDEPDIPVELPCYLFNDRCIWGLSLMMLDELMDALV